MDIDSERYGDLDQRSYQGNFDKIESLGWKARCTANDGARGIYEALEAGRIDKTPKTITLEWYRNLVDWHKIIHETEMYGGILDI